jgi:hypothetical protein
MSEDVMAPARPSELEAKRLNETNHVGERDIRHLAASDPRE